VRKRLHAKNKTVLHRSIGISRPALERLFKRGDYPPQVPGQGWPIDQWQRYADNNIATWNRRDPHKNGSNGSKPNPRDAAYIEAQNIRAEKERFDLDVQRGLYWLKEKAKGRIARDFGILMRELDKAFVHEIPPRDEGLTAGEIAKLHRKRLNEILGGLKKLLAAA
jgi:hypothetical protein